MNDEQLVTECKRGERHALEALIEKYYLPLKAFFYKHLSNPAVSEDLTHNVIIKVIRNIEKFKQFFGTKFSTWLFKIAYNEYLNYVQRNPSTKETSYDDYVSIDPEYTDTGDFVEDWFLKQALRVKLEALPVEQKTLIVLRYYNGFSYKEIAHITGLHTGKVKWKLHDAIEKLRKEFRDEEGEIEI